MMENSLRCLYRLAAVKSHPSQYFVCLYRRLANALNIGLTSCICSRARLTVNQQEEGPRDHACVSSAPGLWLRSGVRSQLTGAGPIGCNGP